MLCKKSQWIGRQETSEARERDFIRHGLYVLFFIFWWIWPVVHRMNEETSRSYALLQLDAVGITAQVSLPPYQGFLVCLHEFLLAGIDLVHLSIVSEGGAIFIGTLAVLLAISVG